MPGPYGAASIVAAADAVMDKPGPQMKERLFAAAVAIYAAAPDDLTPELAVDHAVRIANAVEGHGIRYEGGLMILVKRDDQ